MPLLNTLPHVTLSLHQATPTTASFLEIAWGVGVTPAELRQVVLRALAISAEYKVRGWFCNAQPLYDAGAPVPAEPSSFTPSQLNQELTWLAQAILIPLGRLGLTRLAQRSVPDTTTREAIDATYAELRGQVPYEVRLFEQPEAARAWLLDAHATA